MDPGPDLPTGRVHGTHRAFPRGPVWTILIPEVHMPEWLLAGGSGLIAGAALLLGSAIAIGALLDGIPESMVLGLSVLVGGGVSLPMFVAVFISNVPEGLSSTAGWKRAGRGPGYVFGIWGGISVASGLAALAGYLLLDGAAPATLAFVNALAAGAILAMITDTMIPEAFEDAALYSGLIAAAGFLAAFSLHAAGG